MVLSFRFPFSARLRLPQVLLAGTMGLLCLAGAGAPTADASEIQWSRGAARDFSRPLRPAIGYNIPRFHAPAYDRYAPVQARYGVPYPALRFEPLPRLTPVPKTTGSPPTLSRQDSAPVSRRPTLDQPAPRARQRLISARGGRIALTPTNYCVRLCDGFAFPVGEAGRGGDHMQEIACQRACPNAQTALYTAPAGAKDFNQLSRGGQPYTALATAFSYRREVTPACSCRPIGVSQSASALLTDLTLRPGDIAMTRIGVRHFDGARQFPYRAANFSDAVTKARSRQEVAVIRAMEVASLRGVISVDAPYHVRDRIASDYRRAEIAALETRPASDGVRRGFVDLNPREEARTVSLPVVRRAAGLVALN